MAAFSLSSSLPLLPGKEKCVLINGIKQLSRTHLPIEVLLHSLTQPTNQCLQELAPSWTLGPQQLANELGLDPYSTSVPVGAVGQNNKEINRYAAGDKRYEMLWQYNHEREVIFKPSPKNERTTIRIARKRT